MSETKNNNLEFIFDNFCVGLMIAVFILALAILFWCVYALHPAPVIVPIMFALSGSYFIAGMCLFRKHSSACKDAF